jgi:hypothetical protein
MNTPDPRSGAAERIDVNSSADMERWTGELGISREALAKIVQIAGDKAADVRDYIKHEGLPPTTE